MDGYQQKYEEIFVHKHCNFVSFITSFDVVRLKGYVYACNKKPTAVVLNSTIELYKSAN